MIVIGMTGPIGHGKSTFAKSLRTLAPSTVHLESSMIIAEVANAMHDALSDVPDPYDVESLNNWIKSLPVIVLQILHVKCSFDDIKLQQTSIEQHPIEYQKLIIHVENLQRKPELAKQDVNRDNKETYRPFLQWLGGYLVKKVKPTIWYDEIVSRIDQARTQGSELCIVGGLRYPADAKTLRKAGAIIIKVYRPGYLQNDMLDPTERERENIHVDCTIMSNGTVENVDACAKKVLEDIRNDKLQALYQTKDS